MENKKFYVGQTHEFSKLVSDENVHGFAEITGDKNPLHLDDDYARTTMFGERIAHGMIGAGIISGAIGMYLPGPGTTYLGQEIKFMNPVRIGDTLTACIEITEIIPKTKFEIAKLRTTCKNQKDEVVMDGTATVILPQ